MATRIAYRFRKIPSVGIGGSAVWTAPLELGYCSLHSGGGACRDPPTLCGGRGTQRHGRARTKRHDRTQALFHAHLDADGLTDIRAACQTGTPLATSCK